MRVASRPLFKRASAGAFLRGAVSLSLSYTDLISRIATIISFKLAGLETFVNIQICILAFNLFMQSVLVELTNQPRTEHVLVWTWAKKAAEVFRSVTKTPRAEGVQHNTTNICKFTR